VQVFLIVCLDLIVVGNPIMKKRRVGIALQIHAVNLFILFKYEPKHLRTFNCCDIVLHRYHQHLIAVISSYIGTINI
jgi:hypothetical protein